MRCLLVIDAIESSPERAVVAELADALWRAEVDRAPIAPITEGRPNLTVEDAYVIQTANIERRVAAGAVVRGRKVGLTSEPMQRLLGVNEPDSGVLLDDMFTEDGDQIALNTMLQPRVEAEMAFIMTRDLA
jgi:2-keto-4-pentenoate hydratase